MRNALPEKEEELDSFDPSTRQSALKSLLRRDGGQLPPAGTNVNLHFHSFFSYNAEEYSPTHIAWEARRRGLYAAGLCDFDVLDGLEEFINAGLVLGLRTLVSVETRAYVPELASVDINSPGEPGVAYVMGCGFAAPAADGEQAAGLDALRQGARKRNVDLIERINRCLPDIAVNYDEDVLPLTPGGAATERHIIRAYAGSARRRFAHPRPTAEFWSRVLGRDSDEVITLMADQAGMDEAVRARLVKRGGLGYEPPSPGAFPPVRDFFRLVASCGAIPMMAWLDGTSPGEKDCQALLETMKACGAAALNIIPDRNWNISDPASRRTKEANLRTVVRAAESMDLPVAVGTEMNKAGLPFVDDLDGEALKPYKERFLSGARILTGHSILLKYAGVSYVGGRARSEFASVRERNDFFGGVGALPPITEDRAAALEDMGADKAFDALADEVRISVQRGGKE